MPQHKRTPILHNDILYFLAVFPCASTAEVGDAINISVFSARYHLQQLSKIGLVEDLRSGSNKATRWQLCTSHSSLHLNRANLFTDFNF